MIINMTPETQMKQALMTAAYYLAEALETVDRFDIKPSDRGVIIAALINAAALDYQAGNIARLADALEIKGGCRE